ncbi:MAG: hypothetical protein SGBAC_013027, partial [Bacillariaceae sp.]
AGLLSAALNLNSEGYLCKTDVSFTKNALIICGYGELGKTLYSLLQASGEAGVQNGGLACFDLNPSRVSSGVVSGAPVIFGDGAKLDLLKAAGVTEPRAVVVTLKNPAQRRNAISRLRSCLPEGTPIYAYSGRPKNREQDLESGATDAVCDTVESALRFASLLGVCESQLETNQLRESAPLQSKNIPMLKESGVPGLSEDAVLDLVEELGCVREDILESWSLFKGIAFGRSSVPILELKTALLRQTSDSPRDEAVLARCLSLDDKDISEVTFVGFLRATFVECDY